MSEWKEWNGRDDQIDEMEEAQYGVLLSNNPSEIVDVSDMISLESYLNEQDVHEYLICNPHPLADMICQQARTGQPVWVKVPNDTFGMGRWTFQKHCTGVYIYMSLAPDWNIPNAVYAFTEFKEEV